MPKPTLAQRNSFKTWLRYNKPKFANTTIPEFYLDDILSSKASGISTTDNVRVIPFYNFETVDITTDESNDTLFYLPALPGDRVTVSFGSTSVALSMFGEDTGVTLESSGITYVLNQNIPIARGRALTIKGLGGALLQSTSVPIYEVTPSSTNVDEGSSINFVVNTENVSVGTTLYYGTLVGAAGSTAESNDFTDSLTGSFNIVSDGTATGGIATITRSISLDGITEGPETFRLVIRTDSTTGTSVTFTDDITINNIDPSYNFVLTNQSGIVTNIAEEGELVTVTLNTTNIATGTEFRVWFDEEPGTNTDYDNKDFGYYNEQQNTLSNGSAEVITIAGAATTFRVGAEYDFRENENDTFRIILRERTASSSGIALTFTTLQINDVNLLYDVTTDKTLVDEGDDLTVTFGPAKHPVTGVNVLMPDGPVYATLEAVSGIFPVGVNNVPEDFSYPWADLKSLVQTGYHSGYGNSSTFTIPVYADFLEEGLEVFYVAFRSGSYTNPIIARSADITINDTSTAPGSKANGLTFGPVIVNRDDSNPGNESDWYKICNIDDLPEGSSIALFIDGSGSMTQATVQASYEKFVAKLNEKNITITTVTNTDEDWITPFLVDLP
tara:strand:- start:10 stop:1848 length:1839 start_codon:yes stop_codon:yes gene_type:complete